MKSNISNSTRKLNPHLFSQEPEVGEVGILPPRRERDLHYLILDECRSRGWIAFHGSMAERTHRTEGEPDFVILRDGGKMLMVECKKKIGKVSPAQQAMAAHANKLGHEIYIVRSIEEFLKLL